MRLRVVRHLIAHARRQAKRSAIRQPGFEFPGDTEQNMTLVTPVIGLISRRVLNQAHPDRAELPGTPSRHADLTRVLGGLDFFPVSNPKWNVVQMHDCPLVG